MDKNGLFLAAMLDSACKAYAAGVATRLLEADPALESQTGFSELAEEAELRIRLLGETVAAARPALFVHELKWLKILYVSRGQDWSRLLTEVDCLEQELLERLPPTVSGLVSSQADAVRVALPKAPTETMSFLDGDAPHRPTARRYLESIMGGHAQSGLDLIVDLEAAGTPIPEIHDHVIVPVQSEIGRLWQLGRVNIAEEHLGTRMTEQVLTLLRARIPRPPTNARRLLAAGPSGSHHDLGLHMAADRLRLEGWNPITLGADVPVDDCAIAARAHAVELVAISLPMTLNIRQAHAMIRELKGTGSLPVIVGGRPLAVVEDLWEVIGADAGAATAAGVVEAARTALHSGS